MNVLQEYFTYLTHEQTHLALRFLFEQLMHGEVDIRRQSAHLIGQMTANYDRTYRKELPKDVELPSDDISAAYLLQKTVETILYPDYQVTEQHRKWQGYSLRRIVHTLMASSQQADREIYRQGLLRFIKKRIMMRGTHFCCSIRQRLWIMRKWTIKISVQSVILQYPAGNGTAVQGR